MSARTYHHRERVLRSADRARGTVTEQVRLDPSVVLVRWDDFPSEPQPCPREELELENPLERHLAALPSLTGREHNQPRVPRELR